MNSLLFDLVGSITIIVLLFIYAPLFWAVLIGIIAIITFIDKHL